MKLLVTAALAAMIAFGLNATDLAGAWKGSMETQGGKADVTITIAPGAALTGTVTLADYAGPIENGKLEGHKVSFDVKLEPGKVSFQGTVTGDEMKLDVTGTRGDQYSLTCNRQK